MTIRQVVVYNIIMEMKFESTPTNDNDLVIKDTREINAKSIVTMLIDFSTTFGDLIYDNKAIKEFYDLTDKLLGNSSYKKIRFIIESLPWTVADAFLQFLRESPNIHVTID